MEKITFTCETITPMFLSGADGVTPELRPPSIKGALRFWWRAMNGHLSLEDLKTKEDEIFGGTDGRSKVLIRVKMLNNNLSKKYIKSLRNQSLTYMAYGVEERLYFDIGTKFNIIFTINEQNKDKYLEIKNELIKSFSLLTHLGGLGAKSRNGFGAFTCEQTNNFETIIKYENFKNDKPPFFTAITNKTEIYQSQKFFDNWQDAISELKNVYADIAKKGINPKDDRKYIAAPYKTVPIPARHSKLHLMSLTKIDDNIIYVITYLPYDYMKFYKSLNNEALNDSDIQKYNSKWKKVMLSFNQLIDDAKDKNDDFFVNFTFKKNE